MRVMTVLRTILFGYLGAGLGGLVVGLTAFTAGFAPAEAALVAPYVGIVGGLAGAGYGAVGHRLNPARTRG